MSWIKDGVKIIFISSCLFLITDFLLTWVYGARGFSKFFISNTIEGRQNKPGFTGGFGSLLDEFHGSVTIGLEGERLSDPVSCENLDKKVMFIGDSTTAGFEVDDNKTFVSLVNKKCIRTKIIGVNFGVRAHDTHAVIGTYERISSNLAHDYVVYLMTENDFLENVNPDAYRMMTRKFGRRYKGELIEPDDDLIFSIYASVRVFVGDRLSLTTKIIQLAQASQVRSSSETEKEFIKATKNQASIAFELIERLAIMVKAKGAKLIVMPYPWLSLGSDSGERNENIEHLNALISDNLESALYVNDLDSRVRTKIQIDAKQLSDMRFQSDSHLSEYGHHIMAQVLLDIFQDLKSNDN